MDKCSTSLRTHAHKPHAWQLKEEMRVAPLFGRKLDYVVQLGACSSSSSSSSGISAHDLHARPCAAAAAAVYRQLSTCCLVGCTLSITRTSFDAHAASQVVYGHGAISSHMRPKFTCAGNPVLSVGTVCTRTRASAIYYSVHTHTHLGFGR